MARGIREESPLKPFQCETCPYNSPSRYNFKIHVHQAHSAKYNCGECDYNYTGNRSSFVLHSYKHSGAKNFRCGECGWESAYKSTMRIHLRNVHGIETRPDEVKPFAGAEKDRNVAKFLKKPAQGPKKTSKPNANYFDTSAR